MGLTSIANQLTPGRPTQITFGPQTGLPNSTMAVLIIGHMAASGSAASGTQSATGAYIPLNLVNVADPVAASGEAAGYFGAGTELAAMIVAAVKANQDTGNFVPLVACPLAPADADLSKVVNAIDKQPVSFVVSPFDANNNAIHTPMITEVIAMSAAGRVQNNQYGSFLVACNRNAASPSTLFKYDTPAMIGIWLRDTGVQAQLIGEVAASCAAQLAGLQIPFNPINGRVLGNVNAPLAQADWISVGAGLESETALAQGWSPLRILPNGTVAWVRSRTARVTTGDGVTAVTGYFDVQDFLVLYYWRKTLVTRFNQPDLTQTKASAQAAQLILAEVIRLAGTFEDQNMFQDIKDLAKLFLVQRNLTDRSRFDVYTPVNVIPGLMVIATNIQASTQGDFVTV